MPEIYYISGQMTGADDLARPAFEDAAKKLRAMGYEVINPHELHEGTQCVTWEDFLRVDIAEIARRATRLALLRGWEQSPGARLEVHVARALGMPCLPIEDIDPPLLYGKKDMDFADAMGHQRGIQDERKRCAGIMNFVMQENRNSAGYTPAFCYEMIQDGRTLESVEAGKHHDLPYVPEPAANSHVYYHPPMPEDLRKICLTAAAPKIVPDPDAPALKYRLGWTDSKGEQKYDFPELDADYDTIKDRENWLRQWGTAATPIFDPGVYHVDFGGAFVRMEG